MIGSRTASARGAPPARHRDIVPSCTSTSSIPTPRRHDPDHRGGGRQGGAAGHHHPRGRVRRSGRPRSRASTMTRSLCPGLLARVAEGEADVRRRPCHRLLRRYRPRRGARAGQCAGGRHRRSCVPHGQPARHRFTVVTTLSRSIPVIEHNLVRYGLDRRCARVRAADVPVLALDNPTSNARARIGDEIARALDEDGADAIVLGCAGMADLTASLSREFGVPVVDGVAAAVVLAEGLAALGSRPRAVAAMHGRSRRTIPASSRRFSPSDEA